MEFKMMAYTVAYLGFSNGVVGGGGHKFSFVHWFTLNIISCWGHRDFFEGGVTCPPPPPPHLFKPPCLYCIIEGHWTELRNISNSDCASKFWVLNLTYYIFFWSINCTKTIFLQENVRSSETPVREKLTFSGIIFKFNISLSSSVIFIL